MEINVAVSVPVITQINIAILIPPPALLGNLNIFIFKKKIAFAPKVWLHPTAQQPAQLTFTAFVVNAILSSKH